MAKLSAKESAEKILSLCSEYGWKPEVRGAILTITKYIKAGSTESFCKADSEYYSILSYLPTTSPGSMWGTDGGGVGALSAMKSGVFVMNKSGGSKRVLKAIEKMLYV